MNISPSGLSPMGGCWGLFRSQKSNLNTTISRSRHDIVPATTEVKICAVGGATAATLGEDYTTPLLSLTEAEALLLSLTEAQAAAPFFVYNRKRKERFRACSWKGDLPHLMTGPPSGGIVHQ